MATQYSSSFDQTLGFTETCAQINPAANVAVTYTLPGTNVNKYVLTFGCGSNVAIFVGYNQTPVLPVHATTTASQVEMVVPGMQRFAIGGDVLSFLTADSSDYLSISVRSITN